MSSGGSNIGIVTDIQLLDSDSRPVVNMTFPMLNKTLLTRIKEANQEFYNGIAIGVIVAGNIT